MKLINDNYNQWYLRKLDYRIQDLNSLPASADINIALKKFGELGELIVLTPNKICDEMGNSLLKNFFKNAQKNNSKFLDIAGTAGVNRMKKFGFKAKYIQNAIYTIPKSSICYELTRKIYEMLNLNTENILTIY